MRLKLTHIALLLSILALAISLFTAAQVSRSDDDALIDALMAQNQALQEQIDALANDAAVPGAALTATGWADGLGADVTLTLDSAPDGEALLRVMLADAAITEVPCVWNGTAFTATASLPAENGYVYSLIVGSEAKTLASPEDPVYPDLVYLADALSAYCNLVVGDWFVRDNVLTLADGYATIHTPRFSAADMGYTDARLVLKHGDEVLATVAISPAETEELSRIFACPVENAAFPLPELAQGEQVDLWLEATLTDGQLLSVCAATWYVMPSGFSMAAG